MAQGLPKHRLDYLTPNPRKLDAGCATPLNSDRKKIGRRREKAASGREPRTVGWSCTEVEIQILGMSVPLCSRLIHNVDQPKPRRGNACSAGILAGPVRRCYALISEKKNLNVKLDVETLREPQQETELGSAVASRRPHERFRKKNDFTTLPLSRRFCGEIHMGVLKQFLLATVFGQRFQGWAGCSHHEERLALKKQR